MSKETKTQSVLETYKSAVMPTYSPTVVISSGKGVTVRDIDNHSSTISPRG